MSTDGDAPAAAEIKRASRRILDKRSHLRIEPERIKTFGSECPVFGGQAEVLPGYLLSGANKGSTPIDEESKVAVKTLYFVVGPGRDEFFDTFANQVRIMGDVSHPNIGKFLGFVEDETQNIAWLLSRWEENGNLREFIASGDWGIPERIFLAQDITRGLLYLHTRNPPIFHGDLKAANILVTSNHRAIITDFGSARFHKPGPSTSNASSAKPPISAESWTDSPQIEHSGSTLTLKAPSYTLRWAAPEVLLQSLFGLPGDIWAFGWILWEVLTKNIPFPDSNLRIDVTMRIIKGNRPEIRDDAEMSQVLRICSLMMSC